MVDDKIQSALHKLCETHLTQKSATIKQIFCRDFVLFFMCRDRKLPHTQSRSHTHSHRQVWPLAVSSKACLWRGYGRSGAGARPNRALINSLTLWPPLGQPIVSGVCAGIVRKSRVRSTLKGANCGIRLSSPFAPAPSPSPFPLSLPTLAGVPMQLTLFGVSLRYAESPYASAPAPAPLPSHSPSPWPPSSVHLYGCADFSSH